MIGYKLFIFIKGMILWNYSKELYNNTIHSYNKMYKYVKDYYYRYNDVWLFIPGHTFPISLNNVHNKIQASWIYDNYKNTLTNVNNTHICKLSWLSAKVKIENTCYEMDSFIEKFTIYTDIAPSLYIIFICWCAHTKQWFTMDNIIFHIFDDTGDEVIRTLDYKPIINNNKIY